jgi:hypothetical protein
VRGRSICGHVLTLLVRRRLMLSTPSMALMLSALSMGSLGEQLREMLGERGFVRAHLAARLAVEPDPIGAFAAAPLIADVAGVVAQRGLQIAVDDRARRVVDDVGKDADLERAASLQAEGARPALDQQGDDVPCDRLALRVSSRRSTVNTLNNTLSPGRCARSAGAVVCVGRGNGQRTRRVIP